MCFAKHARDKASLKSLAQLAKGSVPSAKLSKKTL
jgi:hypothetical protein